MMVISVWGKGSFRAALGEPINFGSDGASPSRTVRPPRAQPRARFLKKIPPGVFDAPGGIQPNEKGVLLSGAAAGERHHNRQAERQQHPGRGLGNRREIDPHVVGEGLAAKVVLNQVELEIAANRC